jgi:hypothetical protein
MNLVPFLAVASGEQLIDALWTLCVWGVIAFVLWWVLHTINPPEPWKKVATVIIAVFTAIVLIRIMLGLSGHKF